MASKMQQVQAVYGDQTPNYLWFHMGDKDSLNEEERNEVRKQLFGERTAVLGDIEIHLSRRLGGFCLRIRNPQKTTDELSVGNQRFALYQVGHSVYNAGTPRLIMF